MSSASTAAADTGVAAAAPDGDGRGPMSIPAVVGRVRPWVDGPR
ncbi:hypothetical protein [Streptomyces bathyalis]|nr:hypothetical protein [Streptomyces bathyalis]